MFFWNSLAFSMIQQMLAIWSHSSAFSKTSLNIREFTVHVLLKPGWENFEHYFTSVWDECKCAVVWAFFGIAFLWDWNENWPFPVLWALLSFHICWHIECSTFKASSFRIFQFIVIHTVKGFGLVNKAEIDVFLELSCFFHDPTDLGNLISGFSAFSKTILNIRKFMVQWKWEIDLRA